MQKKNKNPCWFAMVNWEFFNFFSDWIGYIVQLPSQVWIFNKLFICQIFGRSVEALTVLMQIDIQNKS